MNRLREAREYIGLSLMEVAGFMYANIDDMANVEAGDSDDFSPSEWGALSRLYRRPVGWLKGEPESPVEVPAGVFGLMECKGLSDTDRREVVAFVQFLEHRREA